MSTCFKKLFSPVFIDNYEQHKAKRFLHSFVDIAKETACEKNQRKEARLPLELLEVFASLNKRLYLKLYAQFFTAEPVLLEVFASLNRRPDFWKSLSKIICAIFHCRTSTVAQQNLCLYQKFISRFTDTLIIVSNCFLIFWFCIKGKQVYCTWISCTPALLVSIQLLFSLLNIFSQNLDLRENKFYQCANMWIV